MITSAAILQDGVIYLGRRHKDCRDLMLRSGIKPAPRPNHVQGFVTDDGRFLDRNEAETHARSCGQLTKPLIGSILTSEDLWR